MDEIVLTFLFWRVSFVNLILDKSEFLNACHNGFPFFHYSSMYFIYADKQVQISAKGHLDTKAWKQEWNSIEMCVSLEEYTNLYRYEPRPY